MDEIIAKLKEIVETAESKWHDSDELDVYRWEISSLIKMHDKLGSCNEYKEIIMTEAEIIKKEKLSGATCNDGKEIGSCGELEMFCFDCSNYWYNNNNVK